MSYEKDKTLVYSIDGIDGANMNGSLADGGGHQTNRWLSTIGICVLIRFHRPPQPPTLRQKLIPLFLNTYMGLVFLRVPRSTMRADHDLVDEKNFEDSSVTKGQAVELFLKRGRVDLARGPRTKEESKPTRKNRVCLLVRLLGSSRFG